MDIRFYNTLTNVEQTFAPLEPPDVRIYSCGPTVYDFSHVGNFRSFLFADLLNRFLTAAGYNVIHAMNLTDVGHMTEDDVADASGEDKMAVASRRLKEAKRAGTLEPGAVEDPDNPFEVARYYTRAFIEDAKTVGMKLAWDYPGKVVHATDHIPEMQELIQKLIGSGHAYVADDGVVYYHVESYPEYGRLSGNDIANLKEGEGGRISEKHQAQKKHPADFFLWKPDAHHIMKWDSPWGEGYPGWHVECSAMAMKVLEREVIDIHTGGEDNIFPHHECEIAQSCGATGHEEFARVWMHPRHLFVEGGKMSKSEGTFYTVGDVLEGKVTGRPVDPGVLRFELIKTHYRANLNFTEKGLHDSANTVRRLREFRQGLEAGGDGRPAQIDGSHPVVAEFLGALSEDLNISAAMAVVFEWMSQPVGDPVESLGVFEIVNNILNVGPVRDGAGREIESLADGGDTGELDPEALCRGIDEARASKDYATADALRDELVSNGYEVRTTPEGTVARRMLA